jgi:hypothetical protein
MAKEKYNATKALLANLPVPGGEPDDYWEKNLEQNEKLSDRLQPAQHLPHPQRDDRWAGVLGFDEFSNQVMKRKPPPFDGAEPGPWGDVDDIAPRSGSPTTTASTPTRSW